MRHGDAAGFQRVLEWVMASLDAGLGPSICIGILILLTIMVSKFLWGRRGGGNVFWFCANWVAALLIAAGILGGHLLPDVNGLSQRVMYSGIIFLDADRRPANRAGEALGGTS